MTIGWRLTHFYAAVWNSVFLAYMTGMLAWNGNIPVDPEPGHAVGALETIWMLGGFACSLACVIRSIDSNRA